MQFILDSLRYFLFWAAFFVGTNRLTADAPRLPTDTVEATPPQSEKSSPAEESTAKDRTLRAAPAILTWIDQIDLPARDAGSLSELLVHEGEFVKAGQIVARLEDAEQRANRDKAQTEAVAAKRRAASRNALEFAKVSHEIATADLRRAEESEKKFTKSVSQTELDQLRLLVEKARCEIVKAEEERELAELDVQLREQEAAAAAARYERRQLVAPFKGMIAQRYKPAGEWVQPGEKVLRLLRTDRLRIEVFVPHNVLPAEPVGIAVRWHAKEKTEAAPYVGTVTFVSPEVNPVNGQVRVWAELDNSAGKLRAGMTGELELLLSTAGATP